MTPGAGPILTPGNNLNKPGRGPLGDATYRISRLSVNIVSDKNIFPYISLCITIGPRGVRISDSLNEGLPIKMTIEKFQ